MTNPPTGRAARAPARGRRPRRHGDGDAGRGGHPRPRGRRRRADRDLRPRRDAAVGVRHHARSRGRTASTADGGPSTARRCSSTSPSRRRATRATACCATRRTGAVDVEPHAVTLAATVYPQHGWPFQLDTTVRHELVADGMVVTHTVANVGARRAPFAVGSHPFLRVGDARLGDAERHAATPRRASRSTSAASRSAPRPWRARGYDLRAGRWSATSTSTPPTATCSADADGVRRTRLTAPDGTATELWQDESFPTCRCSRRGTSRATASRAWPSRPSR